MQNRGSAFVKFLYIELSETVVIICDRLWEKWAFGAITKLEI